MPRDYGINYIQARKDHRCYGMGLGVMLVDELYPGFPGDARNASGFPFPIQYDVVKGVNISNLVFAEDKSSCLQPIIDSTRRLEKMGCRAISAECGYFAYFQREVAAAVNVPVFLSSLIQVTLAQQVIAPNKVIGIIGLAESKLITDELLEAVGIRTDSNYVICCGKDIGATCDEFEHLWIPGQKTDPPGAYFEKAEKEFVDMMLKCFEKYPNMGAMVLNCSGWQPFARALQRKLDIPIFSLGTLFDYAYSVVVHRDYYGHV